jgi:hypothetical protein
VKLPNADPSAIVPLVVPSDATEGETTVRIWSEPGQLPLPPSPQDGWAEQNIEDVPSRAQLPVLVLRASRVAGRLPLRLRTDEPAGRVLIEKALVRVEIGPDGMQSYQVGYRLGRLVGDHLDFELPAPAATISLSARLKGKRIIPDELASDAEGPPRPRGTLIRLRLSPQLVRQPAVLELSYQLSPDRLGGGPMTTRLQPPRPLDEVGGVPARWQVIAPPRWVVLAPEPGPGSRTTWGLRGFLLAPRSRLTTAELDAWFNDREVSAAAADGPAVTPTLVLWRDGAAPLTLTHFPQQPWLIVCSLGLVLLGLVLSRLALSPVPGRWAWACVLLSLAVCGGLVLVVFAPGLAGLIAYGCEYGLLVLVLIIMLQWLLHERYRRQIIFLPSFSRPRSGSSLARAEAARPVEPSTVDAPPRGPGSSVERTM